MGLVSSHWVKIALIAAARLLARKAARAYVRQLIRKKLRRNLLLVCVQAAILSTAYGLVVLTSESLGARLVASAALWAVAAYNLAHLITHTIPALLKLRRWLRGLPGFALRHVLGVSIAKMLVETDVLVLGACILLGSLGRWGLGTRLSLWRPWAELWTKLPL